MENLKDRIDTAYMILSGDDRPDRACKRIPDSSCTNLPRNYVLNVVNGTASKLAEQVASAKVALPWLLSAIGAPASLVGFLLPLRQAGTLLPQLFISGQMRRFPVRKWFWVGSAVVQVLMLILMIVVALTLPPLAAGILVATFLLIFSLARGVGSLSFQDVTGKTIPKGRRGRMLAARSMIGGLLTVVVGIGLKTMKSHDEAVAPALLLLFCGALLWSFAALAFAAIREDSGATEGGRNAIAEARIGMGFVMKESWYLRYLAARTALLSVEIAAPFYVLYVKEKLPVQTGTLGVIIVAAGLAAALSSPIWGKFADLSSRKVLVIGGLMGAATGAAALCIAYLPSSLQNPYVYGFIFVLLGFAEAGVLLGRKTFLIDQVDPAERTTYVAFANTAMGVVVLVFGFLGVLAQIFGIPTLIVILIVLGITGAVVSYYLPETPKD
ncbi:MAG: MFS transporter [Desulfobacterales bacterium]